MHMQTGAGGQEHRQGGLTEPPRPSLSRHGADADKRCAQAATMQMEQARSRHRHFFHGEGTGVHVHENTLAVVAGSGSSSGVMGVAPSPDQPSRLLQREARLQLSLGLLPS